MSLNPTSTITIPTLTAVLDIFRPLKGEIQWTTARWLVSDLLGIIDAECTKYLAYLIKCGYLDEKIGYLRISQKGVDLLVKCL